MVFKRRVIAIIAPILNSRNIRDIRRSLQSPKITFPSRSKTPIDFPSNRIGALDKMRFFLFVLSVVCASRPQADIILENEPTSFSTIFLNETTDDERKYSGLNLKSAQRAPYRYVKLDKIWTIQFVLSV